MKKINKLFIVPLLLPTLFGCSKAKIHKINFKNFGAEVPLELFEAKLNAKFIEADALLSTTKLNLEKSIKLTFDSQSELTSISTPENVFYTSYNESSGKILYDSVNQRFLSDTLSKTYVINHVKSSKPIEKDGPSYSKSRLYGETLEGKTYIYDLDYKTVSKGYDLFPIACLPASIESDLYVDILYYSKTLKTYINKDKTYTLVCKTIDDNSSNSYETTFQLVFKNGIQILRASNFTYGVNTYKKTGSTYTQVKIETYSSGINKINYNTPLQPNNFI